jgi:hypothetical protein
MTKRTPQAELFLAYFQALHDVGVALAGLGAPTPTPNPMNQPDMGGASPDGGTVTAPADMAEAAPTPTGHPSGNGGRPTNHGLNPPHSGCDFAGDLAGSTMPASLLIVVAMLLFRRRHSA